MRCVLLRVTGNRSFAGGLKALHLRGNPFGDAGAAELASALGDGALSSLGVLDLGGCEIGPSGAADLADAFEHGASAQLVSLYLDANPIRGAGAAAVSSAICAGALPELRLLDLCDCWLDERDTRLFQGAQ